MLLCVGAADLRLHDLVFLDAREVRISYFLPAGVVFLRLRLVSSPPSDHAEDHESDEDDYSQDRYVRGRSGIRSNERGCEDLAAHAHATSRRRVASHPAADRAAA